MLQKPEFRDLFEREYIRKHKGVLLANPTSNMTGSSTLTHQDYTVGWICAQPHEFAAAQGMLDERHPPLKQDDSDRNSYILGRIGARNVVVACLPAGVAGNVSATKVATQMRFTFKWIKFGLMVGIGGGVPSAANDIRLGDIVVSQPVDAFGGVIQYDYGKTVKDSKLQHTGSLNKPPGELLSALSSLKARHLMDEPEIGKYLTQMATRHPHMKLDFRHPGAENDRLYDAKYDHPDRGASCGGCDASKLSPREPRNSDAPVIHYGLIASSNQEMEHGATRDCLRQEHDVLCFEMEAAGLMDDFPCLVIRGICDYSDSHKNKKWQMYAAATAAAYAKELLNAISRKQASESAS
jgi:nucleoside phosphorylase